MERLTTNKKATDMGMTELALNCCYIAEDGTGRYRDYEMDMNQRDFARNLMTTLAGEDLPLEEESFDEEMMDNLMIDPFADVRGLIALFYRNMWTMAELREALKRYEDAEEQGLLIRLPCKVGDTLYFIHDKRVIASEVLSLKYHAEAENHGVFIRERVTIDVEGVPAEIDFCDIGKTVFLTCKEAEAKLKEMI